MRHNTGERRAREGKACKLCRTPIEYVDRVCPLRQQSRRISNRWAFLILVGSGVLAATGFVLRLSEVDPLAALVDIAVVVGFVVAVIIVDRLFRKVEHSHCWRNRGALTASPFSSASKRSSDQ